MSALDEAITPETSLVSIMTVNNEIGKRFCQIIYEFQVLRWKESEQIFRRNVNRIRVDQIYMGTWSETNFSVEKGGLALFFN